MSLAEDLLELSSCGLGQVGGRREGGAGDSRQKNSRYQCWEAQAQCNEGTWRRAAAFEEGT